MDNNIIPCEICDENVPFEQYETHVTTCRLMLYIINNLQHESNFDELVSDTLGVVYVGVDNIENHTTSITKKDQPDVETCPICQESISIDSPIRRLNKCSHCFCSGCIEHWLHMSKKCPLCMIWLQ